MAFTVGPLHDTSLLLGETFTDEVLGGTTVGICGSGGDAGFAAKTFAKIGVRSADVLAKGMAAFGFIDGKVVCTAVLAGLFARDGLRRR